MDHPNPNLPKGRGIAYVREATEADLPQGAVEAPGKLFSIHDAAGNRLALVPTRDLAFAVIRRNDMVPVSVH